MNYWQACEQLLKKKQSFVTVTLADIRGSAPQDLGAKMLVTEQGLFFGTVGGGKVELAAITHSQKILKKQDALKTEMIRWNLQKDIGMSCGGEVTFLFEKVESPNWQVVIFGAGHVAQSLTRILLPLNCSLHCIDSRKEWIDKLPDMERICHPNPCELVKNFSPNSYFISMTMGHAFDLPILKEIASHAPNCPYVGVIGSQVKGQKIKAELLAAGVSADFLEKLRVPVGLDFGTNDPSEIAISIAAELLMVRDQLNQQANSNK